MTNPDDPAFLETYYDGEKITEGRGLTKREYFAATAMQGICYSKDEAGELIEHGYEWIAKESVKVADALIAELSK